jgi:hypothetical protein
MYETGTDVLHDGRRSLSGPHPSFGPLQCRFTILRVRIGQTFCGVNVRKP